MRVRILRGASEAGRDPGEITLAYNLQIRVGEHRDLAPSVVSGSAEAVVSRLLEFVELGFTAFNFMPAGPDHDEQVERLARDVVPALRGAV
jgi:hypothetical protein